MSKIKKSDVERLAIDGGPRVRSTLLPYGRQNLDEADIQAVVDVLRSDWLTTGPLIGEFESAFANFCGVQHAVAFSNGTAALHAAMFALDIGPGDEVIVPPMTFAASANCIVFQGGTPVFADVDANTLLIDPVRVEEKITPHTKAIIAVDYAGQACDYDALLSIADRHGVALVADACHSLGGAYKGRKVGSIAKLNAFSLHPVKPMTTGEGGLVTTDDSELAQGMRRFRNHGITTDLHQRERQGSWFYEMVDLGYNYRLTDFQCALGLSQLNKLPDWISRRQTIAGIYDEEYCQNRFLRRLTVQRDVSHGYHLYIIALELDRLKIGRAEVFSALRAEGIGVNVHYIPVHLHPFYRNRYGFAEGNCPVAEKAYERILSLPIFPSMDSGDISDVIKAVNKVTTHYAI